MPWPLLLAASLAMFTVAASGTTRAPFLIDMARDLSASVPLIANLVAITSIAWGITSIIAGAGSDRWGTRPFLIGGPLGLAVATTGVATGGSFLSVAAWATLAGGFCGLFSGTIFTEVSSRVLPTQQGRALGWVMSGQSLTLLIGVPLAAWVGSWIGWRGVNVCIAGLALITAGSLIATTASRSPAELAAKPRLPSLRTALSRPVMRLLAMGIAERICYGLVAVYYATFLQSTYGLALDEVALPLGVFAIGNIIGTLLGGQLADRLANRLRIFACAMFASAFAALALFGWQQDVETSVALGFCYVFCNAIARPSLMASLSDVPEHVRGTVMGMNVTSNSIGWLGAAGLGGWMIGSFGFAGFGPLAAAVAVIGGGLALPRRR
jgi:predicted MFS family arabinose efflux permease